MITDRTFENLARPLKEAAGDLTITIGEALKELYIKLSEDPSDPGRYERAYRAKVNKALAEWKKVREKWVAEELPKAYRLGLAHADREMEALKELGVDIGEPDQEITDDAPLLSEDNVAPF